MCNHQSRCFLTFIYLLSIVLIGTGLAVADNIRDKLKIPEPGNTQIITLNDGSSLRGEIIEVGENEIKFKSDLGEMTIDIDKITEIKEVSQSSFKGGKYWFPNPNRTRLYFSPTARCLEQGNGYFSSWYLFFPGVTYAITDNISLGGGFSIFPGLDIPNEQFLYLTPKVGISTGGSLDFAVSALVVFLPPDIEDEDDEDQVPDFFGLLYGLTTIGSDNHSLTLGLGYGYAEDEFGDKPAVIVGGETRVSRRMSLVAESWILPGVDEPLIAYGTRFFGEGLAVDLAFLTLIGEDGIFPGIPYLGFVYNF